MADLHRQLEEDRALRDSARKVFQKELAHVRRETRAGAIGERIANRIGAKADAATDAAVDFAGNHTKTLAAGIFAMVAGAGLWIARGPIAERFSALLGNRNQNDAGDEEGTEEGEDDQDE